MEKTDLDKVRELFEREWLTAKKKGYKPGYVTMKLAEKGQILPRAWQREVLQDYEADDEWRRKEVVRRALKRKGVIGRKAGT